MAFQVKDGYGSVISIDSSIFGSSHRQIVGASIIGAVATTISGNPSISGTVGASVIGLTPIQIKNSAGGAGPDIQNGLNADSQATTLNAMNVATFGWLYNGSTYDRVRGNSSIGTLVSTGASSVILAGTPNVNVAGSVVAFQGTSPWVTVPTSGSVIATQGGGWTASIVNTVPSSVLVGASIFGQLPAGTAVLGSVAVLQGTALWNVSGSVAAVITNTNVNVSGSVVAFQAGTQSSSVYGMRNDALASFLGADLTVRPKATDAAGRTLTKPFAAEEARIEGYITLTSTSVTTLVAAAGAGLRNYITDLWAANTGASNTLLTLYSGSGSSVLGYTIVPTGGGTNLIGLHTPIRTEVNAVFGVQAATATSTLYVTVKGYKAP